MIRVFILIGYFLFLSISCVFSQETQNYKNDLRTLFLNNQAIIYEINLRTFNANDANNNDIIDFDNENERKGTFLNAISRLDELTQFNINTLHILPITKIGKIKSLGTAGSLYALSSFSELNPELSYSSDSETIKKEAKKFIEECHKRNIRVIIDLPSCGAYDYFLTNPNLFVKNHNLQSIIPLDWVDVRLFKTKDDNGKLFDDLYKEHIKFINLMLELNVDGIRADVAAIKPYLFWKNLIDYTRLKDSEFLFLAESSDSWKKPISDYAPYTNYFNLLKAGFDGYYGSFFNLKSFKNITQFEKLISFNKKLFKKFNNKKSVIGCFSTHDELSPILIGGKNFSILTMWLNATLNINPYFVDGIYGADNYIYKFSNKKLNYTFTDNDIAYVHEGKLDIFNFSRKPKNDDIDLINMFKKALDFRVKNQEIINNGRFSILKTSNKNVFAYQIEYNKQKIIVLFNNDYDKCFKNVFIYVNYNNSLKQITSLSNKTIYSKNKIITDLQNAEIQVYSENL